MNQRSVRRIKKQLTRKVMVKGEWKDVAPPRPVVQRMKRAWSRRHKPAGEPCRFRSTRYGHLAARQQRKVVA